MNGWYDYGISNAASPTDIRWAGQARRLDRAQTLADVAVAEHDRLCARGDGEP